MTETELEYQFCFNCNDRKNCYTKPKDCTRIKEEIGLQDMTNEEWLKSMNTEQLAEALYHITCFTEPLFVKCMRKQTDADAEKAIMEWLKEIHE